MSSLPGNVLPSAFLGLECHPGEDKVLGLRTVNRWFPTSHLLPSVAFLGLAFAFTAPSPLYPVLLTQPSFSSGK